ncbi:MAG: hypothetical protein JRI31_12115 [Deltaproteobacteria bacterium]|nr:hypothetical protein [Deltaproteobacteria bacterium]
MSGKYAIVIDTDVVRGATNNAKNRIFRDILLSFLETEHLLAISTPLWAEWFKQRDNPAGQWEYYISLYSYRWLTEMKSRKRVRRYDLDHTLEGRILSGIPRERTGEVKKDMHLVLTALAADKRIISNDQRERRDLQKAGRKFELLCDLVWPPLEQVCAWLREGAPQKDVFLVC